MQIKHQKLKKFIKYLFLVLFSALRQIQGYIACKSYSKSMINVSGGKCRERPWPTLNLLLRNSSACTKECMEYIGYIKNRRRFVRILLTHMEFSYFLRFTYSGNREKSSICTHFHFWKSLCLADGADCQICSTHRPTCSDTEESSRWLFNEAFPLVQQNNQNRRYSNLQRHTTSYTKYRRLQLRWSKGDS
jgi:hypothetical protein